MISPRVAALEAEVQCCWQYFLASLAPESGPERPSLRPARPRARRVAVSDTGLGPVSRSCTGHHFSANSSHLNTTGYQFRREFSLTEGAARELAVVWDLAAAINVGSWRAHGARTWAAAGDPGEDDGL
jgi:hypothetical protein